jgi:DNA polymerase III subunit delta'
VSFSSIRDQAVAVRLLHNVIQRRRVPNGLLFWGPGGVGKHLTALEFAKALNCTTEGVDACDTCLSCRKIASGNHPDVKMVVPAGKARLIGVEAIDFINELASYRAFEGVWRVVLILEAERMNLTAQNHFLKTLEEPPSNTLFILITEYPRILLPTVRSRCQQVRFGSLRRETVTELLLQTHDLPKKTAEAIAAISQGQMSRAINLVETDKRDVVLDVARRLASGEDPLKLSEEFVTHLRAQEEAIKAAVKADLEAEESNGAQNEDSAEQKKEQMALAEALVRRDVMEYLYLLKTWYRDILVYRATGDAVNVLHSDQLEHMKSKAEGDLEAKLGAVEKAWLYIERNLSMDRVFRDLFFALAP